MLEALGVRTLGEFAALPAPSVARPLEADYQALARGESGAFLRAYAPESPIREEVVVSSGDVLERPGAVSGPSAIALVARRIALRLGGRGRGAVRLEVTALAARGAKEVPVTIDHALSEPEPIAQVLASAFAVAAAELPQVGANGDGAWRLRVVVVGEAIVGSERETGSIFEAPATGPVLMAMSGAGPRPITSIHGSNSSHASPGSYASPSAVARAAAASAAARAPAPEALGDGELTDAMAVVLSTSGSLFALSPPDLQAERRDAHRRTRRGKQRRGRPAPLAQSRLFDRSSS